MANVQINQLPVATIPLDGTELIPADQGIQTVQLTVQDIVTLATPYKVYTALLSFDGTTITTIVLQNTLGTTINWTNPFNGFFTGTVASGTPFTIDKTWIASGAYNDAGQPYFMTGMPNSIDPTTVIDMIMYYYDGTRTGTPNVSNMSLEIRVYN